MAQLRVMVALAHAGVEGVVPGDRAALERSTLAWIAPDGRGLELADADGISVAAWRDANGPDSATLPVTDERAPLPEALAAALPPWTHDLPIWRAPAGPGRALRWRLRLFAAEDAARIADALALCGPLAQALAAPCPTIPLAIASARARCVDLLLTVGAQPTAVDVAIEVRDMAERAARLATEEARAQVPMGGDVGAAAASEATRRRAGVADGLGVRALVAVRLHAGTAPSEGWTLALA